jgi:hypothetical protein
MPAIDDDLFPARVVRLSKADLATLGYSFEEDGPAVCARGPAQRLARLIERAARDIPLVREEWNAVADVLNGCADLYDYADSSVPPLLMITANLQDSPGLGEKWEIDVPGLCRKLNKLSPVQGEAILAAVRWFWRHTDTDHTTDEWWTPKHRGDHAEAN